jgi:hypothetical protein
VDQNDSTSLNPAIAVAPSGSYVLAYMRTLGYEQSGIYAQPFTAAGARAGAELRVDDGAPPASRYPVVSTDAAGNFAGAWYDCCADSASSNIVAQLFSGH